MLRIGEVKEELTASYGTEYSVHTLTEIGGKMDIGLVMDLSEYLYPVDKYDSLSDKLDEISETMTLPGRYSSSHRFNLFPAKEKTDEIFPDFLCICKDTTKLNTAFTKMKQVSDRMVKKYGQGSSPLKNVILITDKWDTQAFKKHESDFMYKAINYDIWFVILLVVGDELRQIPFLPNDRNCFRNMRWARNEHFEEEYAVKRQGIEYPPDGFSFQLSGGPWAQDKRCTYYFDTINLRWHKEVFLGDVKEGKIPKRSLDKFLRNIHRLMEDCGNILMPHSNSCDDACYTLDVFNTVINWTYSNIESNEDIMRLQRMIGEFIKKCDEDY